MGSAAAVLPETAEICPEYVGTGHASPTPLGPDSLTWKYFGDIRLLLMIFRGGLLQNMHPAVSRALEQHSGEVFLSNPWNRLLRSLPPILGVIYDGPQAHGTGKTVRDFHKGIKGKLRSGESYHALSPEIFYWTHAVFFESIIATQEYFGTPLDEQEQEQLYRESVQWYALYGLSMRPVPPDYASFKQYWARMLADLRATEITSHALGMRRTPPPFPWIPTLLWRSMDPLVTRGSLWLARGMMPPQTRAALGWSWSHNEERVLRTFGWAVRQGWKLLPEDWCYMPRARQGRRRVAAMS